MSTPVLPLRRMSRQERSAHNRALMLQAAWECFIERDYDEITVDAVAERAGFSRVTAYAMFGSKAGLFFELMLNRVKGRGPSEIAPMGSALATLKRNAIPALRKQLNDPDTRRLTELLDLALGLMRRDDALMQRYRGTFREHTDQAAAELDEFCHAAGEERPDAPREVVLLMAALNFGIFRLIDIDPDAVTPELWLRGLAALMRTPAA